MRSSDEGSVDWERFFWSVFERSRNPIWLLDEQRLYVEVNAALCKLLGLSRDQLVGTRVDSFLAPQDRSKVAAEWRELWETGDWVSERTMIDTDGSRIHVQLAGRTGEVGGRCIAVVVCMRAEPEQESAPAVRLGELTRREREILSLVALGHTSSEIAAQLMISTQTVRTHVSNAMAKTGARTRAQLVAMALADRHIGGDR
jgi:PAS domain S-box-containing protein